MRLTLNVNAAVNVVVQHNTGDVNAGTWKTTTARGRGAHARNRTEGVRAATAHEEARAAPAPEEARAAPGAPAEAAALAADDAITAAHDGDRWHAR